jgi:hypothetical protein
MVLKSDRFPCQTWKIYQKYIRLSVEDQTRDLIMGRPPISPGLAEIGKPKSNWELQGLLGLAAFILGFLAGK